MLDNSSDEYEIVIDNEIFFIKQTGNEIEMTNQVGQVVKNGETANCNNYITWSDGDIWRRNMNECAQSWSTVESGRSSEVKADDPQKDKSGRSGMKADDPWIKADDPSESRRSFG